MKILLTEQYERLVTEMAATKRTAQEIDDFFEMLDAKKFTFAYAYTANVMDDKLRRYIIAEDGTKEVNPMYGKLYKVTKYKFNFGKTYREAVRMKNPQYQVQSRNVPYEKVQGYRCVYFSEKGNLMFPFCDYKDYTKYYLLDDSGNVSEVMFDSIKPYMQPSKTVERSRPSGVNCKSINVDKIYRLNAGGKTWSNRIFIYPFLIPVMEK